MSLVLDEMSLMELSPQEGPSYGHYCEMKWGRGQFVLLCVLELFRDLVRLMPCLCLYCSLLFPLSRASNLSSLLLPKRGDVVLQASSVFQPPPDQA